ncbi:MAG: anti-sigma regulatory factor [Promethearchaeati archaeon SRVP18_Atabeyarchaeia-1]
MVQVSIVALEVTSEADIVIARVKAKAIAEAMGFNYMDQTRIATAVSELARNAFQYAGKGMVTIRPVDRQGRRGIEIVVEDHGPGIRDLESALKGGHSTSRGLGMGLSGSKKLMNEFDIKTKVGEGTEVTIRKWL